MFDDVIQVTDADIIAASAEATASNLMAFATGEVTGAAGEKVAPEAVEAVAQCAGAFRHFAAQIRIALDNVRKS